MDFEAAREKAFRKSQHSCPLCGQTTWGNGEDVGVFVQHIRRDGLIPEGQGFPALALVCLTCGFIRLHAIDVLESQTDPRMN